VSRLLFHLLNDLNRNSLVDTTVTTKNRLAWINLAAIRFAWSRVSGAAVTPIRAAVASTIGVQSAAVSATRSADTHAVATGAACLLRSDISTLYVVGGKATAAARARHMWRLWWEEREVDEANQHDDTEERHCQEWVDKDESQNGGERDQFKHLDGKETTVRELGSTHLSKNVWRKRWDEANAASNHALDLGLDSRVRVNGLEDATLKVKVSTDSASHAVKVLAKGSNRNNGQKDVEKSEVDKGLGLLLNSHDISLNNHALRGLSVLQSLSTRRRNGSLLVSTHQATVAWAPERERETRTLEHIGAHF
jgi:hypothetical protein